MVVAEAAAPMMEGFACEFPFFLEIPFILPENNEKFIIFIYLDKF